jgi:hypothetical protein
MVRQRWQCGITSVCLPVLLTACAAPQASGIWTQAAPQSLHSIALSADTDPSIAEPVREALVGLGYRVDADAPAVLEAHVSDRPAKMALSASGSTDTPAAEKRTVIALCKRYVRRIALALVSRETGQILYRGRAETSHCKKTRTRHDARLAQSALRTMQATLPRF